LKGGKIMTANIDVHDLPEEDVKLIQGFVEFLREKAKTNEYKKEEGEEVKFTAHPSDVIGKLTREEIYDHL
jgi:hypothetical protein